MKGKRWSNKEKKDAKLFGSRRTPRSGGLWFAKGDSKSNKYLIENKTSKHNCYTIKDKIWEKIAREALLSERIPLLSIEFGDKNIELVIMSKDDFLGGEVHEDSRSNK